MMVNKKKILVVTPRFPFPLLGGDVLRIYYICNELSKHYEITLLSLYNNEDITTIPQEYNIFKNIYRVKHKFWNKIIGIIQSVARGLPVQVGYYYNPTLRKKFNEIVNDYDSILYHLIRLSPLGDSEKLPNKINVMEMTDAISLNYKRSLDIVNRLSFRYLFLLYEYPAMKKYEEECLERYDAISIISNVDKDYFLDTKACVKVFPNGVIKRDKPSYVETRNELLFIGNLRTKPNQDACTYFIESILPLTKKVLTSVRFVIIGYVPFEYKKKYSNNSSIIFKGTVDNIEEHVDKVFCGICPMRIGAGLQNKILDYMSLQLPTVTTSIGLEGINADIGNDVLVADTPQQFSNKLLKVFRDKDYAENTALNGYNFVVKNFSWTKSLSKYPSLFEKE